MTALTKYADKVQGPKIPFSYCNKRTCTLSTLAMKYQGMCACACACAHTYACLCACTFWYLCTFTTCPFWNCGLFFQIHAQFPLSFEYNQYFLKFVAYHYVSNRFRTFMLDTEFERMDAGWLLDDHLSSDTSLDSTLTADEYKISSPRSAVPTHGTSMWDYIEHYHHNSPVFHNFMFSPFDQEAVSMILCHERRLPHNFSLLSGEYRVWDIKLVYFTERMG